MESKNIGINFDLQFQKIQNLNPSFDLARVAIAYHGLNRNHSIISKEVFEKALPSLYNVPIVGRYVPEEEDFGSHDVMVAVNKDGEYSIENATVPFGVIPESALFEWENVTEEDGTEREYLFTNCVIWRRSYGYETLISQSKWSQSMEIAVNDYDVDDNGDMVIKDMTFTALCILGNDKEPCFESASIQMGNNYEMNNFATQFSLMIDDLKQLASNAIKFGLDGSNEDISDQEEGGKHALDEIEKVVNTEATEEQTEEFEQVEAAAEETTEDPVETPEENSEPEPEAEETDAQFENTEDSNDVESANFAATYNEKRECLCNAVRAAGGDVMDADGNIVSSTWFYLSDFDDEYVYVEKYVYTQESEDREFGRFNYVIGESDDVALSNYETMVMKWLTLAEAESLEAERAELNELRDYRDNRIAEDHHNEIDAVIGGEFSDVVKTEEFESISKDIYELSVEDAREKLFAIRGKHTISKSKEESGQNVKIPVTEQGSSKINTRYGNLFEVYAQKK